MTGAGNAFTHQSMFWYAHYCTGGGGQRLQQTTLLVVLTFDPQE